MLKRIRMEHQNSYYKLKERFPKKANRGVCADGVIMKQSIIVIVVGKNSPF
jgi:hypothetical protein